MKTWLPGGLVRCHLFTEVDRGAHSYEPDTIVDIVDVPTEDGDDGGTPPDVILHCGNAYLHTDVITDMGDEHEQVAIIQANKLPPDAQVYVRVSVATAPLSTNGSSARLR